MHPASGYELILLARNQKRDVFRRGANAVNTAVNSIVNSKTVGLISFKYHPLFTGDKTR